MKKLVVKMLATWTYWMLNFFVTLTLKLSALLSAVYVKIWGLVGTSWFDHRFDHLRGPDNWVWNERGVYGAKLIRPGDRVLDICSGDGIYSGLFYSMFAGEVHAIDRDTRGINFAIKHYAKKNVKFIQLDVTKDNFPSDNYDVIVMFAAIEHFSIKQGTQILKRIAKALSASSNGRFIGSTPIFNEGPGHTHPEHDNEFTSLEQLRAFLSPHFQDIEIWSSSWRLSGERKDTYFLCSKPILP